MGKFKQWMYKLEGKEEPVISVEFSPLPSNVYNTEAFSVLVTRVLSEGVGGELFERDIVDKAFEWASHPEEDTWSYLHSDGAITQEVYNICLSWDQQLNGGSATTEDLDAWVEAIDW